jgi:hypothetical protein
LFKKSYITRIVSSLLLLAFVLGITPKKFLHDAFAKHIDIKSRHKTDQPYQISIAGYNCDCDNLVAESTFIYDPQAFTFPVFHSFCSYTLEDISFSSISKLYSPLRGPPVKI